MVPAIDSRLPLTFNEAHSPVLRLGHGPGPASISAPHVLQAKLTIGEPGDQYEQEADRVAEQVMRMPGPAFGLPRIDAYDNQPGVTREPDGNRQSLVRRRCNSEASSAAATAPAKVHDVLRSPGQQLDASTRAFMEPRFGQDFSDVRIHGDVQAAASAREIGALAFTVGRDIVFGSQYAPATAAGRHVLAHELAHVVQQRGQVRRLVQRLPIHMESGRFVGQIGGADNNNRDEVLNAMDRLAQMNAYASSTVYQTERTAVAALPAAGAVSTAAIPATISAISTNETPELDSANAGFLGLTLNGTVGRGMNNASDDVIRLMDMLHANWHITSPEYAAERATIPANMTSTVADTQIPRTIAGITRLKVSYVAGTHTARFRRQLEVSAEADRRRGRTMTWVPSNPGSGNTFATWATAATQPSTSPPWTSATRINCWEMVLLAAFEARRVTWQWIHDTYTSGPAGSAWFAFLTGRLASGGSLTYRQGDPNTPRPHRGQLVFWNAATGDHVAVAQGSRNGAGEELVISFWPPPGSRSIPGTADAVKETTIEALSHYVVVEWHVPPAVTFANPPW